MSENNSVRPPTPTFGGRTADIVGGVCFRPFLRTYSPVFAAIRLLSPETLFARSLPHHRVRCSPPIRVRLTTDTVGCSRPLEETPTIDDQERRRSAMNESDDRWYERSTGDRQLPVVALDGSRSGRPSVPTPRRVRSNVTSDSRTPDAVVSPESRPDCTVSLPEPHIGSPAVRCIVRPRWRLVRRRPSRRCLSVPGLPIRRYLPGRRHPPSGGSDTVTSAVTLEENVG